MNFPVPQGAGIFFFLGGDAPMSEIGSPRLANFQTRSKSSTDHVHRHEQQNLLSRAQPRLPHRQSAQGRRLLRGGNPGRYGQALRRLLLGLPDRVVRQRESGPALRILGRGHQDPQPGAAQQEPHHDRGRRHQADRSCAGCRLRHRRQFHLAGEEHRVSGHWHYCQRRTGQARHPQCPATRRLRQGRFPGGRFLQDPVSG